MKYGWVKPQRRFFGPNHWGHEIQLYVSPERFNEFSDFLDTVIGKDNWRMTSPMFRPWSIENHNTYFMTRAASRCDYLPTRVKFLQVNHALRLKLMWAECTPPRSFGKPIPWSNTSAPKGKLNKVLLPLIRRVMPQVIANSIIGVSPMQGPVGSIHSLRARYSGAPASSAQPAHKNSSEVETKEESQ